MENIDDYDVNWRLCTPKKEYPKKRCELVVYTESMLDKVAEYYEAEVEEATKNLTTIMEPMVIILLAVLVGGILGAVLMPMLGIYENAGNA